jgi:1-phosphofructokinase family hexose kinase
VIFTTVFNPALDVIYDTDSLEAGHTYTQLTARRFPAGKGINVAKAVRALGEPVTVIGVVPENDRPRFEHYLNALDIDARLFAVPGDTRINATILEKQSRRVTHLNAASEALTSETVQAFTRFVQASIGESDLWALSGSLPRGMPPDTYQQLTRRLRETKNRTVLDTSGDALRLGITGAPDIVKPNQDELISLTDAPGDSEETLLNAATGLISHGPGQVCVSLGDRGLLAVREKERLRITGPTIDIVDTVGAGDALVAGLIVGTRRGLSFEDTCRLAVASALSNCLHRGAGEIDADDVSKFIVELRSARV